MADIVLKDRNGNNIEYPGVNHIKVKTTDGETRDFVDSETVPEVVENLPITLDFSGGNQEIVAPDGIVVKSAVIQQPANLIPANIAEGVNIAGIIGSLAGAKVKVGTFTTPSSTTGATTIEHNMGIVPDLVYVWCTGLALNKTSRALGASRSFLDQFVSPASTLVPDFYHATNAAGSALANAVYTPMDELATSRGVHSVNSIQFSVGDGNYPLVADKAFAWLAIGGLT